ncbi:MAG: peptidylprolyl isomerase [Planctomycetaceae bacterium]
MNRRQFCGTIATTAVLATTIGSAQAADKDPQPPKPDSVPETFQVKFETTKGDVLIEVHRAWSPNGAARFHDAVKAGFYDDCRFFRVIPGFMVQWGINGDPKVQAKWRDAEIKDDKVPAQDRVSNTRGFITFAKSGKPNSRTTQLFINYADNARLDAMGFTPFGKVIEGMDVVDKINSKYGGDPSELQHRIQDGGNNFLDKTFPGLDSIKKATIVEAKK